MDRSNITILEAALFHAYDTLEIAVSDLSHINCPKLSE